MSSPSAATHNAHSQPGEPGRSARVHVDPTACRVSHRKKPTVYMYLYAMPSLLYAPTTPPTTTVRTANVAYATTTRRARLSAVASRSRSGTASELLGAACPAMSFQRREILFIHVRSSDESTQTQKQYENNHIVRARVHALSQGRRHGHRRTRGKTRRRTRGRGQCALPQPNRRPGHRMIQTARA
eukprot:SAG11_NODE_1543_length_4716_cov_6.357375_6_plen_185_part_00